MLALILSIIQNSISEFIVSPVQIKFQVILQTCYHFPITIAALVSTFMVVCRFITLVLSSVFNMALLLSDCLNRRETEPDDNICLDDVLITRTFDEKCFMSNDQGCCGSQHEEKCAICLCDFGKCNLLFFQPYIALTCNDSLIITIFCMIELDESISRSKECQHEFHTACYKQWLIQQEGNRQSCPYCRCDVFNSQAALSSWKMKQRGMYE